MHPDASQPSTLHVSLLKRRRSCQLVGIRAEEARTAMGNWAESTMRRPENVLAMVCLPRLHLEKRLPLQSLVLS